MLQSSRGKQGKDKDKGPPGGARRGPGPRTRSSRKARDLDSNAIRVKPSTSVSSKSFPGSHKVKVETLSCLELRNLAVEKGYLKRLKANAEKMKSAGDSKTGNRTATQEEVDYGGDSSDSDNSIDEANLTANQFKKTEQRIMDIAIKKQLEQKPVTFDYLQFQNARRAKWLLEHIKNLELIVARKANERQKITHEWSDEDMDVEFAKVYGPVDMTAPDYKNLRNSFRSQRLEFLIDLFDKEEELIRCVATKVPAHVSPRELGSVGLERVRKRLERDLMNSPEATIDLNPYSSSLNLDFFLLPRPAHHISAYRLKAMEMADFVEFKLSSDEWSKEGYNAALCDVGCSFPRKIVGDHRRREYLQGVARSKQSVNTWDAHLLTIKDKLREYSPMGVESKLFFGNYRSQYGFGSDEKILGKYSDEEAPFHLSDVFYPRVIGEDKRIILFPSVLEGMIAEPMELMLKFLRRVRFMLKEEKFIKLDQLKEKYEEWFRHSFDPLNWGFERVEDFIEYLCKLFPDETGDVKIVSEEEKAATEANAKGEGIKTKKSYSYELNFVDLAKIEYSVGDEEDTWFEYTETLPSNFFSK